MIFVYRAANSDSAKELVAALEGIRVRGVQDGRFICRARPVMRSVKPHRGDAVVCWGEGLTEIPGLRILNGAPVVGKYEQAQRLQQAGVPTVMVARREPIQPVRDEFFTLGEQRPIDRRVAQDWVTRLTAFINQPERPRETWLPRLNNHIGGADLLRAPTQPDYFSKKEPIVEEYRLHMFQGKSIRAGKKMPRPGMPHHAWIRSYDAGWFINYQDFKSKKEMRAIAAASCEALDLDFAAVDIGKRQDGSLIVLECNRAPGLEGNSVIVYRDAINQWLDGNEVREAA